MCIKFCILLIAFGCALDAVYACYTEKGVREVIRDEHKKQREHEAEQHRLNFGTDNDIDRHNNNYGVLNVEIDSVGGAIGIGTVCVVIVAFCVIFVWCSWKQNKLRESRHKAFMAVFKRRRGSEGSVSVSYPGPPAPASRTPPVVHEPAAAPSDSVAAAAPAPAAASIPSFRLSAPQPAVGYQNVPSDVPPPREGFQWFRTPFGWQSVSNSVLGGYQPGRPAAFSAEPRLEDPLANAKRFPMFPMFLPEGDWDRSFRDLGYSEDHAFTRTRRRSSRGLPAPSVAQDASQRSAAPPQPRVPQPGSDTGAVPRRPLPQFGDHLSP